MKGIELPINILVIVAIAVIVLLGVIALYFIGWSPFSGGVSLMSLKNVGCGNYSMNYGCGSRGAILSDICLPKNSYLNDTCTLASNTANNLKRLCANYFNATADSDCRALCGCV